jgi:hypothetical protein
MEMHLRPECLPHRRSRKLSFTISVLFQANLNLACRPARHLGKFALYAGRGG